MRPSFSDALRREAHHLQGHARTHGMADGDDRPVPQGQAARAISTRESSCEKSATATSAWGLERRDLRGPDARIAQQAGKENDLQSWLIRMLVPWRPVANMRATAEMKQMVCFAVLMNFMHICWPPSSVWKSIFPMRIDFLGLHAFVAIAERGSFQLAAAHLNLSQTALSHRMRKLEDDLGVRLLSRTTREVSLTPAGLELLPKVKGMIEDLSVSLDELAAAWARPAGKARDRLPSDHRGRASAGVLQKFRSAHPGRGAPRPRQFRDRDRGARRMPARSSSASRSSPSHRWDFDIEPLVREPFVLVCRADHAAGGAPAASWSDLQDVPLIRISPHTGNRMIIDDALGSRRESLSWRYEVQHVNTALALVRGRTWNDGGSPPRPGFARIPRASHAMQLRNPGVSRQIGIVSKRSAPLSPLADELRKLIVQEFASRSALHQAS